jgi:hypothetical protein
MNPERWLAPLFLLLQKAGTIVLVCGGVILLLWIVGFVR